MKHHTLRSKREKNTEIYSSSSSTSSSSKFDFQQNTTNKTITEIHGKYQ